MAETVAPVAIALGSNLGDRRGHLDFAVAHLSARLAHVLISTFRNTTPVGVGPQPAYLNGVVVGTTGLDSTALLDWLLSIERERGRERPRPGAARTLDLDLILHGDAIVSTKRLTLPHPRFRERIFVLQPLAEIAPEMVDPVTGKRVWELWDDLRGARESAERGRTGG
jgi:2-amino-4-hydroxy-6-hydroxymethyldihydropteridine diphosphokinase